MSVEIIKSVSYEPIHHKYRPRSFAELVGQEAIATTLTNAIRSQKIAHAYLFTGPRGTGKTSSARILAKSINCLQSNQPTATPCGVCSSCLGITQGYTLDVIEIDAASNTGVDNIRELIEKAQFAPVQSRYKVYVIDECHMLSTAAFNALLKTLEEPPKHVVFILATTDPQRVLPTIISRCQRFDFRRIQLEAMVKHLQAIALQENINITPEAITLVGQLAQGGLRDAESLLDQLALFPEIVTPDHVLDLVGSVSEQDLLGLLEAIDQDDGEVVIDFTRRILDRGREPLTILQNFAAFYRDLLIAKTAPSRQDLIACTQPTREALVNFAQRWDKSVILRGQQQLRTAEIQIKNTTQPRLWLEITLLGLLPSANIALTPSPISSVPTARVAKNLPVSSPDQTVSPAPANPNLLSHSSSSPPAKLPSVNHSTATSDVSIKTEPQEEVTETELTDLNQAWQAVISNLLMPGGQSLFKMHGRLTSVKNGTAQVAMPPKLIQYTKDKLTDVETAFEKVFRQKIKVVWISNQAQVVPENPKSLGENPHVVQSPVNPHHDQPISLPTITPTPVTNSVKDNFPGVSSSIASFSPSLPSKTDLPISESEYDEVAQATKRLVDFFNGKIITLADDALELSDVGSTPELEIYEYNDD